jgi:hypothetical protein
MKAIVSFFKLLLTVVVIAGVYYGFKAMRGEGNAKITAMTPGGLTTGNFHCWVTLEFKKYPEGIDRRDVRVVFSSIALEQGTTSFDWNFIAENAAVPKKVGVGRERAQNTSPDSAPQLNYPIDINFPLVPKLRIQSEESPWLKAELLWGGKKQDESTASVRFLYKRE